MANYTDEELMSFVKNQDVSAFEELFCRYEKRVFAFFYRLEWNIEEARDCTQETFLRLWKGRIRYVPRGRFSTYIFQIAKNHFLHRLQKKKCRITLKDAPNKNPDGLAEEQALSDSAYSRAVAHEVESAVSRAITSLPEIYRLVYVLSEEQRFSYKQIAEVLGCPVGTVSSRKVEAINKLRQMLEPVRNELYDKQ